MVEIFSLQKKVLDLFSKSHLKNKFYWTGGTALSFFYLHHRKSKDLDFFSEKPFTYDQIIGFIRDLKEKLKLKKIEEKKIFDRWEFFLQDKEELRIEFVFFDHPKLKPRKKWKGIFIDSLEDIAANKALAFFDRNDPKDLIDLYFLLKKFKVKTILRLVEKKFGVKLVEGDFWSESFKSFKNLKEISPLLIVKSKRERKKIVNEIKNYFASRSAEYLLKKLK